MKSSDLVATAKLLASGRKTPSQADLRRAASTLYYAMFHELARACADHLAGTDKKKRSNAAWGQTYRSLSHTYIVSQCKQGRFLNGNFALSIKEFARDFAELQIKRHKADYDPNYRITRSEIDSDIELVEKSIKVYRETKLKHRKAFSIFILLHSRNS